MTPNQPPTTITPYAREFRGLDIEATAIDHEMAAALAMLESSDPLEAATGEQLVEEMMQAARDNQERFIQVADALCNACELLRARATAMRTIAAARLDRAAADESNAYALEQRLGKYLELAHPGQTRFSFNEHDIKSHSADRLELDANLTVDDFPEEFIREKTITERSLDKVGLKQAIKAGAKIPGAAVVKSRNWKIV